MRETKWVNKNVCEWVSLSEWDWKRMNENYAPISQWAIENEEITSGDAGVSNFMRTNEWLRVSWSRNEWESKVSWSSLHVINLLDITGLYFLTLHKLKESK